MRFKTIPPIAMALALFCTATIPAQEQEKKLDTPGFKAFEKARKKAQAITKKNSFTLKKGQDFEKVIKAYMEKRKKANQAYLKDLEGLSRKYPADAAINKIRLALVNVYFQLDKDKEGKQELGLVGASDLTLKERMDAIDLMVAFDMNSKAKSMLIGLDVDKIVNERKRYMIITLFAVTGQKKRALAALKEDLSDIEDDEDMWDVIDEMEKMFLSYPPSMARPLLAVLYEEGLKRYPNSDLVPEKKMAYRALSLKSGTPPVPLAGKDLNGKEISLDALKGKVVLIHFWAKWNPQSLAEMTRLKKIYEKLHAKGFEILGVSMDKPASDAKKYVTEQKIPWPSLCDGKTWRSKYIKAYAIKRLPFSVLLYRQGKVAAIGLTGSKLEVKIKSLL